MDFAMVPYGKPVESKRQQIYVWVREADLVGTATDWLQSISTRVLPQRSDVEDMSADEEHVWIGLKE